jgi:hypothetical protein
LITQKNYQKWFHRQQGKWIEFTVSEKDMYRTEKLEMRYNERVRIIRYADPFAQDLVNFRNFSHFGENEISWNKAWISTFAVLSLFYRMMGLFIGVGVNYNLLSTAGKTFVARIRPRVRAIVPRVRARVQRKVKTRIQPRVRAIARAQKSGAVSRFYTSGAQIPDTVSRFFSSVDAFIRYYAQHFLGRRR